MRSGTAGVDGVSRVKLRSPRRLVLVLVLVVVDKTAVVTASARLPASVLRQALISCRRRRTARHGPRNAEARRAVLSASSVVDRSA